MKKNLFFSLILMFFSFAGLAQTVSGTVYLDSGDEDVAIGATVRVKGSGAGAITDLNGQYTINANQGDVLIASFVGYATQEQVVNGDTMNFSLTSSTTLDEVVVTAFGIEKDERSLGFAVQEVAADAINKDGQVNAFEGLQGRVSGVQINKTSGGAGSGLDISIRGITSVNGGRSNQPLIIVDGIAINNDTATGDVLPSAGSNASGSNEQFGFSSRGADINPQDIESYSILKGAAATALYGIRASNGAILITTKKGKKGKPKIGVSTSMSFNDVSKMPTFQETYREGHRTSKIPTLNDDSYASGFNRPAGFTFYSWGVPYTDDSFTLDDGTVLDLSDDAFRNPYEDFFRTGQNTQANFNISGADNKFNYFFSAGLSEDKGIVPNTDYDKTNFRFNVGYQVTDNFKINPSIAYTKSGGKRGAGGDKSIMSTLSYWTTTFDVNDYLLPNGGQKTASSFSDNPRYFAETSLMEDDVNRWIGGVGLDWKPLDFLKFNYNIQVDNYADNRNRFVPADLDVGTKVGGFVINQNFDYSGMESNFLATLSHDFTEKLSSNLLLGHQVSTYKRDYEMQRGEGLNIAGNNALSNTNNLFGDKKVAEERNVGVFGDLRFEYDNRFYLSVTGRNDNLSTLPSGNRSFFYPSTSFSYVFSDDLGLDALSFGKLRTSWAKVGKGPSVNDIGYYYNRDSAFPFAGTAGYVGGYNPNYSGVVAGDNDIEPEFATSIELGTDLRFFENRLRLDYSYYFTEVENQIFALPIAQTSGLSSYVTNAGSYETWGHEFLVSYDLLKKSDFKWTSNLNFSTNEGEVTELPGEFSEISYYGDGYVTNKAKVGDSVGDLYGWVYQTTPSGARYVDADGYNVVTGSNNQGYWWDGANEQVKVGNALPDFILSTANDFSYKDFSLSFLVEWKKGGQLYDKGLRNAIRNGNLAVTELRDVNVVLPGEMLDDNGNYVTNTTEAYISANTYYRSSSRYNGASEEIVRDADWLKLRQVSLGYTLPSTFAQKVGMSSASVNATANNIILWTPWDGFDPEGSLFSAGSNIYGFTGLNVPLSQRYSLGLNFNF